MISPMTTPAAAPKETSGTPAEVTDTRQHILDTAEALMAVKGYTAVGLTEVLTSAGVPKGSFYHYFGSKDAFGEAVLESYFRAYLAGMDAILAAPGASGVQRLMTYWQQFHEKQSIDHGQGRCLVVKLGAEVADLSEAMRSALQEGTAQIITRIARMIAAGVEDTTIDAAHLLGDPHQAASTLYSLWLGASVLAKVDHDPAHLDAAMMFTRSRLGL